MKSLEIDGASPQWIELSALFSAYLNQDAPDEYGTTSETIDAFRARESATTVERAADQTRALLEMINTEEGVAAAVRTLGLEYHPELDGWAYRDWLEALEATLRRSRSDRS